MENIANLGPGPYIYILFMCVCVARGGGGGAHMCCVVHVGQKAALQSCWFPPPAFMWDPRIELGLSGLHKCALTR